MEESSKSFVSSKDPLPSGSDGDNGDVDALTGRTAALAIAPWWTVRDRQEEQNEEDQTNHRDTRILM
jgi:hypothetical protein